jgi:hypothetical protein
MFKVQRIPLEIELLLNDLQQFFNDYQWLHFKSILLALLVTPYKATLNGMVKILSFGSHRSKHNEFLNDCSAILVKVLFNVNTPFAKKVKRGNLFYNRRHNEQEAGQAYINSIQVF